VDCFDVSVVVAVGGSANFCRGRSFWQLVLAGKQLQEEEARSISQIIQ
jgi:hypothetical protein